MKVQFLNLARQNERFRSRCMHVLADVMDGPLLIHGLEHGRFEDKWAEYCGFEYCVGTGNGYDALRIMLESMLVRKGNNIVVASNTHISTWLAVVASGNRLVVVEPHEHTHVIDADTIGHIGNPFHVLATNLYGNHIDVAGIREVTNEYVMLDAAQAHGLSGLHEADAVAFSFYPTKNLGALGDGGAVCFHHSVETNYAKHIRNYGALEQNNHEVIGCNSRLDEIQAAFLLVKMDMLNWMNKRRITTARRYREAFKDIDAITMQADIPSVYHQFVVQHHNRDVFRKRLQERGVDTMVHYPCPPHLQPAFAYLGFQEGSFPVAERLARTCVSLPIGPELTDDEISYVIDCVRWCA